MNDIRESNLALLIAGYLYSLTNDHEGKGQDWHINHFIDMYNEYKDTEHDGDCTNKPWSCDMCFVEKYIDLAQSMIDINKFKVYLKELEE